LVMAANILMTNSKIMATESKIMAMSSRTQRRGDAEPPGVVSAQWRVPISSPRRGGGEVARTAVDEVAAADSARRSCDVDAASHGAGVAVVVEPLG
jgi:hypothetical protein